MLIAAKPEALCCNHAGVAMRSTTDTACTTYRIVGAAAAFHPSSAPTPAATAFSASSKVFAAATGAVSRLVVTTALGAATVKANIVTPEQINGLAKVAYNFFLPCFLFTTLIRTVATYGLSPELLLLMPFAACAQIAIAFLVPLPTGACRREAAVGRGARTDPVRLV